MTPIRTLILDDHVVVRSGLVAYIEAEEDLCVTAELGSLKEAREFLDRGEVIDVAVVDLRLPDGSGVDFLERIADEHPAVRSLILSVNAGEQDVLAAFEAGVCGYLSKSTERHELIDAIRQIAAGGTYFPAAIQRKIDEGHARPKLTDRERAVLEGIARGQSNKEIAETLGIADITVRQYVSSVLRKLGAQDRTQAAVLAIREGHVAV